MKTICPKCESTDIRTDNTVMGHELTSQPSYICDNCGYSAFVFPEIEKGEKVPKAKEITKKVEKDEKVENTTLSKILLAILIIGTGIIPGLIVLVIYRSFTKKREDVIDEDEKELERADELIKNA